MSGVVMLACGHAVSIATERLPDGSTRPACPIHGTVTLMSDVDLSGREAWCSYDRERDGSHPGGPVPSESQPAFFEYQPGEPYDRFYCGCRGWG